MRFDITLAQRDIYLAQIEEEIAYKKQMLIEKKKDLDKKELLNHYLADVKDDYTKYYMHILKDKYKQLQAMILLKEYTEELMRSKEMMDHNLVNAKQDQREILGEIDKIKHELDELIR
jgi:hypothetical protein